MFNMIRDKTIFLPILEALAESDETVVREEAVKSLTLIAKELTDAEMQNLFSPLVLRLSTADVSHSRVSSCPLFCVAYKRAGSSA